jgi:hypothetical protein
MAASLEGMGRYTGNVREMSLRHCKLSAAKAGPEN